MDVAQSDVAQRLELVVEAREVLEEVAGLVDGHVEDFGDIAALEAHIEGLGVVALAVALFAGHVDVREELHLDFLDAVAGADLASAALDIEGEASGLVAAQLGVVGHREDLADEVEESGVGGGVRARRLADGALVDDNHLVHVLQPFDRLALADRLVLDAKMAVDGAAEDVVDQRGLSGAGDPGDTAEDSERDFDVDFLEIVLFRAQDGQKLTAFLSRSAQILTTTGQSLSRHGDRSFSTDELSGHGIFAFGDFFGGSSGDEVSSGLSGSGSEVHEVVGGLHGIEVVFDDDDGVSEVSEVLEAVEQSVIVPLV